MKKNLISPVITLLVIILFVYAALAKLSDYANFQFGLSESPLIAPFAGFLAWAIPAGELAIAVMLVWPPWRLAGLYASFFLMLLFTLYIGGMLLSGMDIPCSCGGILEHMSWGVHLVFNGVYVVLCALAIALEIKKRKSIKHLIYASGNLSKTVTD